MLAVCRNECTLQAIKSGQWKGLGRESVCTHFFLKAVMRVDLEVWPLEAAVGVEDVLGRKRNRHTIEYHVAILQRLSHPPSIK